MAKIVRVSNAQRGKKLILTSGDYEEFILKVRSKFGLDADSCIIIEDDQGAEVDDEIFPALLEQIQIPNITFKVSGEEISEFDVSNTVNPQIFYVPCAHSSPAPSSAASSVSTITQNSDFYQQILQNQIDDDAELTEIVNECNLKHSVDQQVSSKLINAFVAKLIELKGDSPTTKEQKLFAKAIIQILPCWKYPGTEDGLDVLYDEISRSGLIQTRLRWIHRNLKSKEKVKVLKKKPNKLDGGPKPKYPKSAIESQESVDEQLISDLNASTNPDEIKSLMKRTIEHRKLIRAKNDQSVLKVYRKFVECDFLISFEFSLLFPESEQKFMEIWPEFAKKVVENGKKLTKSPALIKFLEQEAGLWDISTAALFILLHLIPPTAQGKGKGARCNLDGAKARLVVFFKTGTPLQSILDTWNPEISQPTLVFIGDNKAAVTSFFLCCDRLLIPLAAKSSTEAIDNLFKSHYVIGTEYDRNLVGIWKFIQVYIFQIESDITQLPRKVKQVFLQLSGFLKDV